MIITIFSGNDEKSELLGVPGQGFSEELWNTRKSRFFQENHDFFTFLTPFRRFGGLKVEKRRFPDRLGSETGLSSRKSLFRPRFEDLELKVGLRPRFDRNLKNFKKSDDFFTF